MTVDLARFSPAEYQRRGDLVRRWLQDNRLDGLVIYANAYGGDGVRWLTGFKPRHDTYLIWPLASEPVLLTQLFNHVPNAQRVAVIADVRWAGPNSAAGVIELLQTKGLSRGQIGLAGRVPYLDYEAFTTALPAVTWQKAGQGYMSLRLVKSPEELAWLRQGAAHTDAAMAALVEAAQPDVSEHELVTAIEAAYTAAGGEHGIHFLSSTPMDAPTSYVPAQTQSARRLAAGDAIICELSAGVGGYAGQIHRAIAVGREPTAHYQRLYDVALVAYEQMVARLKAGVTLSQVLDAADSIETQGLTVCDDLLHGYGLGYLAPVVRTRQTAHSGQPAEEFIFAENMAVVVQPNVYDPASGAGLQVGNLLVITSQGAESLQRYPMEFFVCGK
ncbi:MAG: aminopeptidase P family protein [Anaerolineae bacterium]|nr:aminopeptidase P family protein [Anaerolineae bacterium]